MKRVLSRFLPPLLLMAALYLLSSVPGSISPQDPQIYRIFIWTPPAVQNLLHVPAFALLAWLWCRALEDDGRGRFAPRLAALVIAAAFGSFDEWHQLSVFGRYASLTDLGLDLLGACLGVACRVLLPRSARDGAHQPATN